MNDTRAKLETLFRRLVNPAVSDLDALSDFVWFRKLALSTEDVAEALGQVPGGTPMPAPPPADDGPMWPFKKKHAGESIAHIARTDPDYLIFMLKQDYIREPLKVLIRTALKMPAPAPSAATTKPLPADDDAGDPPF